MPTVWKSFLNPASLGTWGRLAACAKTLTSCLRIQASVLMLSPEWECIYRAGMIIYVEADCIIKRYGLCLVRSHSFKYGIWATLLLASHWMEVFSHEGESRTEIGQSRQSSGWCLDEYLRCDKVIMLTNPTPAISTDSSMDFGSNNMQQHS